MAISDFRINGFDLFGAIPFAVAIGVGLLLAQQLDSGSMDYYPPLCLAVVPGPIGGLLVSRSRHCIAVWIPVWVLGPIICTVGIAYTVLDRGFNGLLRSNTFYYLLAAIVLTLLCRFLLNRFPVRQELSKTRGATDPSEPAP